MFQMAPLENSVFAKINRLSAVEDCFIRNFRSNPFTNRLRLNCLSKQSLRIMFVVKLVLFGMVCGAYYESVSESWWFIDFLLYAGRCLLLA